MVSTKISDLKQDEILSKHRDGQLLSRPKQNARSGVWTKFHEVLDKGNNSIIANYVKCVNCDKFYKYNGGTTSSLQRHKCGSKTKQRRIDDFLDTKNQKISKTDSLKLRDAVTKFIVKDLRPFKAMEGDGLYALLQAMVSLGATYPWLGNKDIHNIIPSKKTVHNSVVNKAEEAKIMITKAMRESLDYPGGFSCTTDIWTDNLKHRAYLCITLHSNRFVNGNVVSERFVISLNELACIQKTHDVIYAEIQRIFASYNVSESELVRKVTFTTDRGGNIKKALSHMTRLNCIAHGINNLVEAMCKPPDCDKIIKDASNLVKYMKSTGLNLKLEKSLKSYCDTRWNTVHDMLESIYNSYSIIVELLSEKERLSRLSVTYKIARISRVDLFQMTKFLALFKKITDSIQGDKYITIIQVWPSINKIRKHIIDHATEFGIVSDMVSAGLNYMEKNPEVFTPCTEHKVAVFLHPLLKSLGFASESDKKEIHEYINDNMESLDINVNHEQANIPLIVSSTNGECLFNDFLEGIVYGEADATIAPIPEIEKYMLFKIQMVIPDTCYVLYLYFILI